MLVAVAMTVLSLVAESSLQRLMRDLVKRALSAAADAFLVRWPVAAASRHRRNHVSVGRNAGFLRQRCGGSRGF